MQFRNRRAESRSTSRFVESLSAARTLDSDWGSAITVDAADNNVSRNRLWR